MAGVEPVGGTSFAVIVQTRYDAAVGTNQRLANRLRNAGAGTLAVALLVCVRVLGLARRRRRF